MWAQMACGHFWFKTSKLCTKQKKRYMYVGGHVTRLFGKSQKTEPEFCHPRAKLIVPTPISCSSGLAFKSAACIQRDVCHSSVHATGREKAERQSKQQQKKHPRQWQYFVRRPLHTCSPIMDQSCNPWLAHDWFCIFMIGRLGLINFARGGRVWSIESAGETY